MKVVDLRKLEVSDLLTKLSELKAECLHTRIAQKMKMKAEATHTSTRQLKKTIARVKTILTEKGHRS